MNWGWIKKALPVAASFIPGVGPVVGAGLGAALNAGGGGGGGGNGGWSWADKLGVGSQLAGAGASVYGAYKGGKADDRRMDRHDLESDRQWGRDEKEFSRRDRNDEALNPMKAQLIQSLMAGLRGGGGPPQGGGGGPPQGGGGGSPQAQPQWRGLMADAIGRSKKWGAA